jgi:hypothetical protein
LEPGLNVFSFPTAHNTITQQPNPEHCSTRSPERG